MAGSSDMTEKQSEPLSSDGSETLTLPDNTTPNSTPAGSADGLKEVALSLSIIDGELNRLRAAGVVVVRDASGGSAIIVIRVNGVPLGYADGETLIGGVSAAKAAAL